MALDEKRRQKKLAKKAAKRKSELDTQRSQSALHRPETLRHLSYEITDEPLPEPAFARLPEQVQEQISTIYLDVIRQNPKEAVATLLPLIEQYPDVPQLYNHLYAAYRLLGEKTQAQQRLKDMRERFPNYLFGRITYAIDCLQRGEVEEVATVFDNTFELKLLYPKRKRFHISEVLSFYMVMAWYLHAQGKYQPAEMYYGLLQQLDPEHEHTRFIGRLLHPPRLDVMLRGLLNRKPR